MKTYLLKSGLIFLLLTTMLSNIAYAYTAVTSGNWSSASTWQGGIAPGSTVTAQDIIIPSGITVLMDVNVTFNGVLNTFSVNGVLNSTANRELVITQGSLSGNGLISLGTIEFNLLATSNYSGVLAVDNFVNNGANLIISSVVELADTLDLQSGNLLLNAGANLILGSNSTIKIDDGTIVINGGILNSEEDYNLMYYGTSKTTGAELNSSSLQDLYINLDNNNQVLTLNTSLTVNGDLFLNSGRLDFSGQEVTLRGALNRVTGALFTSNQLSSLVLEGNEAMSTLMFSTGSALSDLTIDRTGTASTSLTTALGIVNELNILDGDLSIASGGTLTLGPLTTIHIEDGKLKLSGGTFSASNNYDVEYAGSADNITGIELTGTGLKNVSLEMSAADAELLLSNNVVVNGTLDLTSGALNLNGKSLTVTGTLNQAANAMFVGNSASDLTLNLNNTSGTSLTFDQANSNLRRLILNLIQGGMLDLASDLTINTELTLDSGKLDINDNDLILSTSATITGYNINNYIVTSGTGEVQMRVNAGSPFTVFPVGTSLSYSPASIQQVSGASSGNFMVRAMDGMFAQGTTGTNLALTESVVNRTWMIESANGMNINMNLKLGWTPAAEVNGFDRLNAFITHFMNNNWDTYAEGSASAGATGTFELMRNGITSLSPFAVVDESVALGIDQVEATEIRIYPNPANDYLYVEAWDNNGLYTYEVVDVAGKVLKSITNETGSYRFNLADLENGYYFVRISNLDTKRSTVKRFVKA